MITGRPSPQLCEGTDDMTMAYVMGLRGILLGATDLDLQQPARQGGGYGAFWGNTFDA